MHFTISIVAAALAASAAPSGTSPRRGPAESYHDYLERSRAASTVRSAPFGKLGRVTTASDQAAPYVGEARLRPAPDWESHELLQARFETMRDARVLESAGEPRFPRRATWLFPDDGCYARASIGIHALRVLEPTARPPAKIFVFGNLAAKSNYALGGTAYWWYHVAPVVRVAGVNYVLDPSIEAARPLSVGEWIERQTATPESVQVAICGTGTYLPEDRCDTTVANQGAVARAAEAEFLDLEWRRLLELDRDPRRELGDLPPWGPASRAGAPP